MNLCKTNIKTAIQSKNILFDNFTFQLTYNTKEILKADWEKVNDSENIYLSIKYLQILENCKPTNIKYIYIIIYDGQAPIAIAYYQLINFNADIFGAILATQVKKISINSSNSSKKSLVPSLFRLLTLGNNFVSGEHGFKFNKNIAREKQFEILEKLCKEISSIEKLKGKISAVLVKDFYPESIPNENNFAMHGFLPFSVEPNMVLKIPKNVSTLKQYIGLFSKKYRNRSRKIFNCAQFIERKDLNLKEIIKLEPEIYQLYLQVYNNAKFKLVKLDEKYFSDCKKSFVDNYIVTGYFKDGKLVGFSSAFILNESDLEAHFIGFDYNTNKECEIYQNILYNFIEITIKHKKDNLILGRTAAEIKSTIGAKSHEMVCYIKPQNPISSLVLKPFISYLQPSDWIPRNPFKE